MGAPRGRIPQSRSHFARALSPDTAKPYVFVCTVRRVCARKRLKNYSLVWMQERKHAEPLLIALGLGSSTGLTGAAHLRVKTPEPAPQLQNRVKQGRPQPSNHTHQVQARQATTTHSYTPSPAAFDLNRGNPCNWGNNRHHHRDCPSPERTPEQSPKLASCCRLRQSPRAKEGPPFLRGHPLFLPRDHEKILYLSNATQRAVTQA